MQYIKQTNRTILFQEINPNKNNLFTLIGDTKGKESMSDDEIKEIDNQLSVSSFSEFLLKFTPTVYMTLNLEQEKVWFDFERPNYVQKDISPIILNEDHMLIKMLIHMLDRHSDTEFIYQENLSDIIYYLFPVQEIEGFIKLREEMKESFLLHQENDAMDKMNRLVEDYNTPLLQLLLFLNESKNYLFDSEACKIGIVNISKADNTQIQILETSKKFKNMRPSMIEEKKMEFETFLRDYFANNPISNEKWFLFNMLTCCGYNNHLAVECAELYNLSVEFYGKVISQFWKSIRPLLQRMLGIKVFFEQYSVKNGAMPPILLITNCSANLILQEKYRTDLMIYLETVNLKSYYESTIWYAIISNLRFFNIRTQKLTRERFAGMNPEEDEIKESEEAIQLLLDILGQYRIQSFLSTEASEYNDFKSFQSIGVSLFEQSFRSFEKLEYSEYLIPCMPNFTIISKEDTKLPIARKCVYEEFGDTTIRPGDYKTVWLSGLYLEASFVAAALYASCQCPTYLSSKFPGKVDMEQQGVGYQISDSNNRHVTTSYTRKELLSYPEELLDEIQLRGFGIVFGPGKRENIILLDKTIAFLYGRKDCVATIQIMTYIERVLRHATQDYRSNLITEFFQNRPDSIYSKWMKNRNMVNSILKTGETMGYDINEKEGTCVIKLEFTETPKKEIVKISR